MDSASDKGARARRRIRSIEVGFRVIRAMLSAQRPTPLRDIAAAAGMAPSKAHLYLASFLREGMAIQEPETGHYGLGPFAASLGLAAIRQISIVDKARPFLRELSERTGCAAYLSILGETGPAIVSKADGARQGVLSVQLGYVLPLTNSATGQIFLAWCTPERRAELLDREYTGTTRSSDGRKAREKLEPQLAKALKQGYATPSRQINTSFTAVAAPVFDFKGEAAAALTVLGPDRNLANEKLKKAIADLKEMATGLSRAIGAPETAATPPRAGEPKTKKPSRRT
jgi:DNA-binding IclR family transcriptional regulator